MQSTSSYSALRPVGSAPNAANPNSAGNGGGQFLPPSVFRAFKGILFALLCGLRDAISGALNVVMLDWKDIRQLRNFSEAKQARKDTLLRRESSDRSRASTPQPGSTANAGSDPLMAKRRAMERREQQAQQALQASSSSSSNRRRRSKSPERRVKPRILHQTFKCCSLNGAGFLAANVAFYNILLPLVESIFFIAARVAAFDPETSWSNIYPVLCVLFSSLWLVPIFLMSKLLNAFWFQDIADLSFESQHGPSRSMSSVSVMLADTVLAIVLETIFLMQGMVWTLLPVPRIGFVANLLHVALLNSLYAFEYRWFAQGIELFRRLDYIERHWAYFIGFGLPMAVITSCVESTFSSGGLFAIMFPFFIVGANSATVVPHGGGSEPVELHWFKPTILFSNMFFARAFKKRHQAKLQQQQGVRRR